MIDKARTSGQADRPVVSVIIPAYNEERFLGSAIESVLRQTYEAVDIVVVDDGSTDGTLECARQLLKHDAVVRTEHHGASHARNVGAARAEGEFLLFLDSDDLLGERAIEGLLSVQGGQRTLSVCGWSDLVWTGERWEAELPSSSFEPSERDSVDAWLSGKFYPTCAVMWPAELYAETGGWDESLSFNEDGDLILRALAGGAHISMSEVGRSYYRRHCTGSRRSERRDRAAFRSQWKVLRRLEAILESNGRFEQHRVALGKAYHRAAKTFLEADRALARRCEQRGRELAGRESVVGSRRYRLAHSVLGLEAARSLERWTGRAARAVMPNR